MDIKESYMTLSKELGKAQEKIEILEKTKSDAVSLLKKYMTHIIREESISFVEYIGDPNTVVQFTAEEFKILRELNNQIRLEL
jgi:hypothetical protein